MMKRLKKFTAFIMAVVMIMVSEPLNNFEMVAKANEVYGDFEYRELEDGNVEISKYKGAGEVVEIPEEIDGKKVTSIGSYVFSGCIKLTSVELPESLTSIGAAAFRDCKSLTEINIPSNVTSIGKNAFEMCALKKIVIPSGVTVIEKSTFLNCGTYGITFEVELLSGVTTICENAFDGCAVHLKIPTTVTSIDDRAFGWGPWDEYVTIYCNKDSYACSYVQTKHINYVLLDASITSLSASMEYTQYEKNERLSLEELEVIAKYEDGSEKVIENYMYTTNADSIDMSVPGEKTLEITYIENGVINIATITIIVNGEDEPVPPADKKSQTIKLANSDIVKKYGDKSFSLNAKLSKGDGKLTYSTSNKKVATVSSKGKVTIKGTGSCTITVTASETDAYKKATAKISLTVKTAKNKISKIKVNGGKAMTVTWKKDTNATGYEIEYSTAKSFTKKTTTLLTVKNNKTTSAKIKKLTKGKKYYVRVRAYKDEKVNGKTNRIYGDYSAIKQTGKIK